MSRVVALISLASVFVTANGCVRPPEEPFVSSAAVTKLNEKAQKEIRATLAEQCGTPSAPKLLGEPKADLARLRLGGRVYVQYCRPCHGVSGDGNGPSAAFLLPKPRDYRAGIFKFTSTNYGAKPLREDLIRTVRRGIAGTSMPAFRQLPQTDVESVIDYVLALTHRGELEAQLASAAELEEALDKDAVKEMTDNITNRWTDSRGQIVYPATPMPIFNPEQVAEGKQAFLTKGCASCHGEDGRGQMKDNIGTDTWGNPTKAADLTSGMLRGGTEPLDVYRHVSAGINGTPMPSFGTLFQKDPETMWKITAFVLDLSNRRRLGTIPEAGMLKPLPGVGTRSSAEAQPRS